MRKPNACLRKGSFICHRVTRVLLDDGITLHPIRSWPPQQATHRVPDPGGGRNESAMPPAPAPAPVHSPANTEGTGANGLRWRSHRVDSIVHAAHLSRLHWHPARYPSSQSCHDRGSISLHAVSDSQPNCRRQFPTGYMLQVVQATAACCCCSCCCSKGRVGRHVRVSVGGGASTVPQFHSSTHSTPLHFALSAPLCMSHPVRLSRDLTQAAAAGTLRQEAMPLLVERAPRSPTKIPYLVPVQ